MARDSIFSQVRDELFGHIHRCGVLQASPEQQEEWMRDTMEYMQERYPDLSEGEREELSALGLRFCRPVLEHGTGNDAREEGTPADL